MSESNLIHIEVYDVGSYSLVGSYAFHKDVKVEQITKYVEEAVKNSYIFSSAVITQEVFFEHNGKTVTMTVYYPELQPEITGMSAGV